MLLIGNATNSWMIFPRTTSEKSAKLFPKTNKQTKPKKKKKTQQQQQTNKQTNRQNKTTLSCNTPAKLNAILFAQQTLAVMRAF